jgi:hypothetical protein
MNRSKRTNSKKKRRSKSKRKKDNELKRPMNSFMLYAQDVRKENEEEGGEPLTNKEISKRWKKLSLSKKKAYQVQYDKNKLAYEKELKNYVKNESESDEDIPKKSKKKSSKSKRNKNSKKKCDCGVCKECKAEAQKQKEVEESDVEEEE